MKKTLCLFPKAVFYSLEQKLSPDMKKYERSKQNYLSTIIIYLSYRFTKKLNELIVVIIFHSAWHRYLYVSNTTIVITQAYLNITLTHWERQSTLKYSLNCICHQISDIQYSPRNITSFISSAEISSSLRESLKLALNAQL